MPLDEQGNDIDPRIILAAERTLLAWIRTGIALMGFGFVVARFGVFLRELAVAAGRPAPLGIGGSSVGVAVVGAGILVNLWASLRHRRMVSSLQRGQSDIGIGGPVAVGIATAIGGAILMTVVGHPLLK